MRAFALGCLMALMIGCSGITAPVPTPGSMDDVIAGLVLRGASVHNLVSGDAGCPSSALHDNAIRFDLALATQSATHEIFLLRWRRESDFVNGEQAFADCVAEYQALNPGRVVTTLEANPWRAYGTDGSQQAMAVMFDALRAAGGASQ